MLRRTRLVGCIKGNAYAALDAPKPNFVYSDTLMSSLDESTFKEGVLPGDPHGSHNTVPNSASALTGFEVLDGPPSDDRLVSIWFISSNIHLDTQFSFTVAGPEGEGYYLQDFQAEEVLSSHY